MLMLLYSAALSLGLFLASPWWLFRMLTTQRYREGLPQRLGRVPQLLLKDIGGRQIIWLHAVSVGEVLASSRLVTELEAALGEDWRVVISTTTRTGQTLARERFGADRVFYFPLDFAFAVRAYLRVLKPAALVLAESELWPRVLHECQRAGVPVVVVNARMSDRSYVRAMRVRSLWGNMLRKVTLWLAQSEEDARRLVSVGAREGSVRVSGNLKYDVRAPKQSAIAELIRKAAVRASIVVAGSTVASNEAGVESEEAKVIEGWQKGALPHAAMLVLAPRHPERFEEVWKLAKSFPAIRATDLLRGSTAANAVADTYSNGQSFDIADIILLDTIGDLASVYGIADVAFLGGSLLPRGGHNPLEPAQFGVPIIMGRSFENFRDIVADLQQAEGIRIVQNELELAEAFEHLLTDKQAARTMGENGRTVFHQRQGATARAVEAIVTLVRGDAA